MMEKIKNKKQNLIFVADGIVVIRDCLSIRLPYPNMVIIFSLCTNFAHLLDFIKPRTNDGCGLFIFFSRNVVRVMIGNPK